RIYATDLSDELLARARSGALPLAMRRYEARYRAAGGRRALSDYVVTDGDRAVVRHELRRNLVFSRHDLAASDGSFNEFHVVLSRNVARRYAGPVRERVHRVVHDSLARDGILALGRRESLRSTGLAHRYRPLDAGAGLYRRIR
ncbi:MAG TPA: CheR family methyltransferase, partial [Sandaracinaceae bacterium]